jgi:two-component system phosphate regulon sensor histidine kinase PhoR
MSIQRRLLAAFLVLLAAVVFPTALLLEHWLVDDVVGALRDGLHGTSAALASELERAVPSDMEAWAQSIGARAGARVTVIADDGSVLGDSDVAPSQLAAQENHAQRPEVKDALGGRPGASVRFSATLQQNMLYVALPVVAPPARVLRLALPLGRVNQTVARARWAVWISALCALALAVLIGGVVTRWLSRPIVGMTRAARRMSHGDFAVALPEPSDDELGDLVRALDTLRFEVASRIEELKDQSVRLRTILDGMSEGVALIQDGVIEVANPAFARLLAVEAAAIEGKTPLEAARVPGLADAIDAAARERRESEREVQAGARSLALHARPLGAADARQAVVVLLDLTELKRLERMRREFVANASHELRTPVAAIVGVAETLAAGAADDEAARAQFVDILLRHAQRLSRLTSDLLDIARLEGGHKPRVEAVPIDAAVDAVLATLAERAAAKQLSIERKVGAGLVVAAERPAVEQILTNLVDNAIKYTPEGGRITVRAEPRGANVQVAVDDTGPGIAAEHLPRLFERFYRVDTARSRELGGTGLGLSIVKHLVMANRGEIRVESEVGKGSRFLVSLPRA